MWKAIEAKTMNDIEREWKNERVRRKYHRTNILLYVNINSNRKSVFLLFSILFSLAFSVCASSFFSELEITAHTEFLHNANNITRKKKDGESKKRFFFVETSFPSSVGHCTSIV